MSDTNLDPSITALTNRASTVAVTATARELMNISRLAPSLEKTENTDLEVAINARAEDLAPTATATELKSIGKAIGNVLEPETFVAGGTLPNQAQNSGNFLGTNGAAESWGGLSVSTLSEVNISSIMNDETLVYNNVSGLFENESQVFRIQEIALTENIPTSGSFTGQVVFDQQTSELKYWDGSEWKVAAVVAAAGGGGTATVDWTGSQTSVVELVGTSADRFGRMVVMNSNYVAVSAYEYSHGGYTNNGKVTVYSVTDGSEVWSVYGTESHNYMGYTNNGEKGMFMSENLLVVNDGATRSYGDTGARVRLYDVTNGNLLGTFDVSGDTNINTNSSNRYGSSVAINSDETKLAIGSPEASPPSGGKWGRFSVYDISDLNNLSNTPIHSVGAEDLPASDPNTEFGFDLDFSGVNTLVVSAPKWLDGGVQSGKTFIFDLTAAGNGMQNSLPGKAVRVIASGGEYSDGNLVVVASDWQADPTENGLVKIWDSNSFGTGSPTTTINYPDGGTNARFGHITDFAGNYLLVGSVYSNVTTQYAGQIYIYQLDGTLVNQIASPNATNSGGFGYGLAVDSSGSGKWSVGAVGEAKVYVFQQAMSEAGGGSGSSYTVVDWSGLDSTVYTVSSASDRSPWDNSAPSDFGNGIGAIKNETDGKSYFAASAGFSGYGAVRIWNMTDGSGQQWIRTGDGQNLQNVGGDNGAIDMTNYNGTIYVGASVNSGGKVFVWDAMTGAQSASDLKSIAGFNTNPTRMVRLFGTKALIASSDQIAVVDYFNGTLDWYANNTALPGLGIDIQRTWSAVHFPAIGNIALGENYAAFQDLYHKNSDGTYQAGCVYIINVSDGTFVRRIEDPNPRSNGRFGGKDGPENGLAISGDKILISSYLDGTGKVYIFDMTTGNLDFTIDQNSHASIATANNGQNFFGEEIETDGGDYAVISKYRYTYIVQISTGQVVYEGTPVNTDRVAIAENYIAGGYADYTHTPSKVKYANGVVS